MQISILNQPLIKNKASLHLLITLTKPFFSPFGLNIFKLGLCPTVDYSDKSEVFWHEVMVGIGTFFLNLILKNSNKKQSLKVIQVKITSDARLYTLNVTS